MTLKFPRVDEIPLLVKLVSAGEQDILPVLNRRTKFYCPRGIVLSITAPRDATK